MSATDDREYCIGSEPWKTEHFHKRYWDLPESLLCYNRARYEIVVDTVKTNDGRLVGLRPNGSDNARSVRGLVSRRPLRHTGTR